MTLREVQRKIDDIYGKRDGARGRGGTFLWFMEEVGELAEAMRRGSEESMREEFADVFAWLVSLASIEGIDVEDAVSGKYGAGCPACGGSPCGCQDPSRPEDPDGRMSSPSGRAGGS